MNARMYAVTPAVEAAWRDAARSTSRQEPASRCDYVPYPAPQPLETLWARAGPRLRLHVRLSRSRLRLAPVVPLAAPIPRAAWADGTRRSIAPT